MRGLRPGPVIALALGVLHPGMVAGQRPAARDSAGIAIRDIVLTPAPRTITMAPKASATIGGLRDAPDEELVAPPNQIHARRIGANIVVADGGRLLLFRPDGTMIRVIGRTGSGPGEFRQIVGLCVIRDDSLIALDQALQRYALFDPTGRHVRTAPLPGFTMREACLDDGAIIIQQGATPGTRDATPTATYSIVGRDGGRPVALGQLPAELVGLFMRPVSFVGAGRQVYFADGIRLGFLTFGADGRLVGITRSATPPLPLESADVDRRLAAAVPASLSKSDQERSRANWRRMPIPETWPMLRRLIAGPDGIIWLQEVSKEGRPADWLAVRPDGRVLGRLPMPVTAGARSVEVIGFGRNEVVLFHRDAEGAAIIAMHPLRMPSGIP